MHHQFFEVFVNADEVPFFGNRGRRIQTHHAEFLKVIRLKNGLDGKTLAEYNAETKALWNNVKDNVHAFNEAQTLEEKQKILSNPSNEKKK